MVMSKTALILMWALYFNGHAEVIEVYDADTEHYAEAPDYCSRRAIVMMKWSAFDSRVSIVCTPYTKRVPDPSRNNAFQTDVTAINDIITRAIGPADKKHQDEHGNPIERPIKAGILWRLGYDGVATVLKAYDEYGVETCPWMADALSDNEAVFLCADYPEVPKDGYSNLLKKGDTLYATQSTPESSPKDKP